MFLFAFIASIIVILWPINSKTLTVQPGNPPTNFVLDEIVQVVVNQGSCQMTASRFFEKSAVAEVIGIQRTSESDIETVTLQVRTLERGVPGTLYQVVEELQAGDKLAYDGEYEIQIDVDGNCTLEINYDFTSRKTRAVIVFIVMSFAFLFWKKDELKAELS